MKKGYKNWEHGSVKEISNAKYPNGYTPKIHYWKTQLLHYVEQGDVPGVEYASKRLQYFMERQFELSSK